MVDDTDQGFQWDFSLRKPSVPVFVGAQVVLTVVQMDRL